ncbi:MAG TPA: HAD-IC family P-type ATPase, partial [Arenibacter sp.]|nr:HAD-IC family P-type ATPase [Arenibacter sp.]
GQGIMGTTVTDRIRIGSPSFVGCDQGNHIENTAVHISANDQYKGRYVFKNNYREGVKEVFDTMSTDLELAILSGDNAGEEAVLTQLLPLGTPLYFNQKPDNKLEFISALQDRNKKVMMVGDGLNDAGALAQSDVGIAISENVNVFSPACDGILDAQNFKYLYRYILASRKAIRIIKLSFMLSLMYNVVGLSFAVTGRLEPVVAAILMPLSSISIVLFTTIATNLLGRKLNS